MAASLKTVFTPCVVIGDIVKGFNFSSIDTSNAGKDDGLCVGLAPALGELNKNNVKDLSDPCKIMLAGTLRVLNKLPAGQRNYETVLAQLMQNQLIEGVAAGIARSDRLLKQGTNVFKIGRAVPTEPICKETQAWFNSLIQDQDVLTSTNIDANVIAQVVLKTGQAIDSFLEILHDTEVVEKTLLDICVLRLPDVSLPVLKLYNIKIVAWSQHKRVLAISEDSNGLTGVFNCRTFKPRMSVIESLADNVKPQAIAEAEAMFD